MRLAAARRNTGCAVAAAATATDTIGCPPWPMPHNSHCAVQGRAEIIVTPPLGRSDMQRNPPRNPQIASTAASMQQMGRDSSRKACPTAENTAYAPSSVVLTGPPESAPALAIRALCRDTAPPIAPSWRSQKAVGRAAGWNRLLS